MVSLKSLYCVLLEVSSTLVGATNNYGVFLGIPSGTGRWNLYASGTANNYLAGSLGIGTTSFVFGGGRQ